MFYDSKQYFNLMMEWMFFVFIILHTESMKLKIAEKVKIQDETQISEFMEDIQKNPNKLQEFIEWKKKVDIK